jgi:NAD(P)-dependent dehydrogenase (short-subunit alcohol dehydrogenase family)
LLDIDPRTLGLPFTIWTINRLRLYLAEQTNILLSYTRFRALLSREGYRLTLAHRFAAVDGGDGGIRSINVGDVGPRTDWRPALEGCDVVVHLAGRVPGRHVAPAEFHAVNNAGTAQPGAVHMMSDDDHRRIIETNLLGPILMTQRVVTGLREALPRVNCGATWKASVLNHF